MIPSNAIKRRMVRLNRSLKIFQVTSAAPTSTDATTKVVQNTHTELNYQVVAGRDTAAVQVSRKFPNFASSSYAP
jgi:hypothetical protein